MAIIKYELKGKTFYKIDFRFANRRQRRGGFSSRADAQEFLNRLEKMAGGSLSDFTAAPIGEVISKYREIVSINKSEQLQIIEARWFYKLEKYLLQARKKKYLHEVDILDLKSYQAYLRQRRSAGTVNRRFDSFKSLFNESVDWGLILESPAERIKKLPHSPKRRKTWRKNEIQDVYNALPERFANLFFFIVATGCRPSEARLLTWRDVDLKSLHVTLRSIKGGQGELAREFPLTGNLKTFMKNHFMRQKRALLGRPSDIVFPSRDGRHFDPTSLQKRVKKIVKRLSLQENLCVYGLRHTFTTKLIEKDINLEKVRLLVGHRKITTTQGYAHVDKKSLREAVENYEMREKIG